jgi:hypothetical protein
MCNNMFFKFVSLNLVVTLFLFTLPSQGWSLFIPESVPAAAPADRALIQKTLESRILQQRITEYGMSPEEARARIDRLSDEQVHQLAANLDSLQAGGDAVGALIFLVAVAIVVIIILQATGHHVIVR